MRTEDDILAKKQFFQQYLVFSNGMCHGVRLCHYKRNHRVDSENEGRESGTLLTEIGYIKAGVDDIKRKQEKQDERHLEIISRVTAVEQSAKQGTSPY